MASSSPTSGKVPDDGHDAGPYPRDMETLTTTSTVTNELPNEEEQPLPSVWRLTCQADALDSAPWPQRRAFRHYAMGICATRHHRRLARIRACERQQDQTRGGRFLTRTAIVCEHVRYLIARPLFWLNITTSLQSS
jgi:hypothetical protein